MKKNIFLENQKKETKKKVNIPSLIKWSGSKRGQAANIFSLFPNYNKYFEPFLGSGALLYLAQKPGSYAGDLYEPLILLWKLIQNEPDVVINNYKSKWHELQNELLNIKRSEEKQGNNSPVLYYKIRESFNKSKNPLDLNFLLRTCVNGIVRFNTKGDFNNSFHLSRPGMNPKLFSDIVYKWNSVIQNVNFICKDYRETISFAKKNDFIYFDPPYAKSKNRYIKNLDIESFFETLENLNSCNIKWALSFDGKRGNKDLSYNVPKKLYTKRFFIKNGHSAVNKVLNGPVECLSETLYINY